MEDDDLGSAGGGDPGAAVERADRGGELPAGRLEMPHEAEQRRMDGERHVGVARRFAEPLGPRIVHPEPTLEVDLAGVVARRSHRVSTARSGSSRTGIARQTDANSCHLRELYVVRRSSYASGMDQPTRIDLLELDIDLRLADLWREAADVTEWNLEVVSAFMRASYGKGYCDAFTEDSPGALCHDHGYEIPGRRQSVRAA